MRIPRRQNGFTLVELAITLIVAGILIAMTIPTFIEARQRASLRGAADQVASFWADARFEALRRNSFVAVTMRTDADGNMCLGARTVTSNTDTACDCFTAGLANCNVARYPDTQSSWRGVRTAGNPTLGEPDSDTVGVAVIDPKRGSLGNDLHAGGFLLQSADGSRSNYRLNVVVDRIGRAFVCEPSTATDKLPQFTNKRC